MSIPSPGHLGACCSGESRSFRQSIRHPMSTLALSRHCRGRRVPMPFPKLGDMGACAASEIQFFHLKIARPTRARMTCTWTRLLRPIKLNSFIWERTFQPQFRFNNPSLAALWSIPCRPLVGQSSATTTTIEDPIRIIAMARTRVLVQQRTARRGAVQYALPSILIHDTAFFSHLIHAPISLNVGSDLPVVACSSIRFSTRPPRAAGSKPRERCPRAGTRVARFCVSGSQCSRNRLD